MGAAGVAAFQLRPTTAHSEPGLLREGLGACGRDRLRMSGTRPNLEEWRTLMKTHTRAIPYVWRGRGLVADHSSFGFAMNVTIFL